MKKAFICPHCKKAAGWREVTPVHGHYSVCYDEKFTDIHPYRLPWADKYRNMDDISAEEFLAHGWWLPCAKCGKQVYEDTAVLTDTKVLCKECAGKDGK